MLFVASDRFIKKVLCNELEFQLNNILFFTSVFEFRIRDHNKI